MAAQTPEQHKTLDTLCEKYPELFINPAFEIKRPDDYDGPLHCFRCADGWYEILNTFCFLAKHHLGRWREVVEIRDRMVARGEAVQKWVLEYFKENPKDPLETFRFDQIKEKFGGLRIYYDGLEYNSKDEMYLRGLAAFAESMSYKVCELCGSNRETVNGSVPHSHYIQTLCVSCRDLRSNYAKKRHNEWEQQQQEAKKEATKSSPDDSAEEGSPNVQG